MGPTYLVLLRSGSAALVLYDGQDEAEAHAEHERSRLPRHRARGGAAVVSARRTVLLDCDGVLADFIGEVIETIVAHGGPRHTHADITEFNFTAALKLDADLARLVKRTISTEPGWWYGLTPFPEAIEGVTKLREVAEVYIVTSPWNSHPNWLHEREAWLKKHFDIPHSHVIATSAKHLVCGDVFVDDKTEAVRAWAERWYMPAIPVQWETPHNRNDRWAGLSTRSWSKLLELARGR